MNEPAIPKTELDEFVDWAKFPRGHYTVPALVANFRKWKAQRKEAETKTLQEKAGSYHD